MSDPVLHSITERLEHETDVAVKIEHQLFLFIFGCGEASITPFQGQWGIPVEQRNERGDLCSYQTVDLKVLKEQISVRLKMRCVLD